MILHIIVKTEQFYACCGYSDILSVKLSESVIITVLKSVTRKRLVKTKYFYVSCGYSDIWSVWFSGTVIIGCGGDP
jgi:uncharacterized protein YunC (DUF1805 family)